MEATVSNRTAAAIELVAVLAMAGAGACGAVPARDGRVEAPAPAPLDDSEYFLNARTLPVAPGETVRIDSELDQSSSVEVFDLGLLEAGERLTVTVEPHLRLDPVVAVFDAAGDNLMVNDDRNASGGDLSSHLKLQLREGARVRYVAVASSYPNGTRGAYTLTVVRNPPEPLGEPGTQYVYLNFESAGEVAIGTWEPRDVPGFEESRIAAFYDGQLDELIATLVEFVRQDYDGLNVQVVSSRESAPPPQPYTTVYFGSYHPGLLGAAEYIDEFNAEPAQQAIVYVDTFATFLRLNPTLEQMAAALANVASHETGHLLGLNHTSAALDMMNLGGSMELMLENHAFRRARLHPEVFPIGHQDSARLLVEAVGGDLEQVKAASAAQLSDSEADAAAKADLGPLWAVVRDVAVCSRRAAKPQPPVELPEGE